MRIRTVLLIFSLMMLVLGIVDFFSSPKRIMESGTWVSFSLPVKFVEGNVVSSGQVWAIYKFVKRNQVVFEVEEVADSLLDINTNPRPLLLNVGFQNNRQRLVFTTLNSGSFRHPAYVFDRPRSNPRIAGNRQGARSRPTRAILQPSPIAEKKTGGDSPTATPKASDTPVIEVQFLRKQQRTHPTQRNTQNRELQVLPDREGIIFAPGIGLWILSDRSHGSFHLRDAELFCEVRSTAWIRSWRLPTANELRTIFEINNGEIQYSPIMPFWTSTIEDKPGSNKRVVVFGDGEAKLRAGGIAGLLCVTDSDKREIPGGFANGS